MNSTPSPNIRLACNQVSGAKQIPLSGICGNTDSVRVINATKVIRNATKVRNYDTTSDTASIDPYAIANQTTAPDCSPYDPGCDPGGHCYKCGDFGVTNNNLPCWPFDPTNYRPCSAGTSSLVIGDYHNCYYQTNETASHATNCVQIGYKAVYAAKAWPGRRSYTSRNNITYADAWDYCCVCQYHGYDPVADTTKYLKINGNSSITLDTTQYQCDTVINGDVCCPTDAGGQICSPNACTTCTPNGTTNIGATAVAGVHVDTHGNLFNEGCSSGSSGCTGPFADLCAEYWSGYAFNLLGAADTSVSTMQNVYCGFVTSFITSNGFPDSIGGSATSNAWSLQWHTTFDCHDACGNVTATNHVLQYQIELTATTLDVFTYGAKFPKSFCDSDGSCPSWVQTGHYHYAYSATSFNYSLDATGIGSISFDQTYNETVNGSLATPYTADQVFTDAKSLLAKWDMGDDVLYPWIHGEQTSIGPYVNYDEASTVPNLLACSSSIQFTGKVQGAPGPKGIDRIWNPYHKNYCICEGEHEPGCFQFYVRDYGAWSGGGGIPAAATQWLDAQTSNGIPQGAFAMMNQFFTVPGTCNSNGRGRIFDDVCWVAKYAELVFAKQSYNMSRPCGADRFQISESAGRCIAGITGGTTITVEFDTELQSGDYCWVCGTGTIDGCWKATVVDPLTIVVHDLQISASLVITPPVLNCGTGAGIISKLKWQGFQSKLCGRIDILSVSQTNPVTCSLVDDAEGLVSNDTVQIENATGMDFINGIQTVQVINSKTIGLVGVNWDSHSVYTGKGQMFSPFAPDYRWNDTTSKGNYATIEWKYDFRDTGEYYRLANQSQSLTPDAAGNCNGDPCYNPQIIADPRPYQIPCALDQNITDISCSTHCLSPNPCRGAVAYYAPPGQDNFGDNTLIVSSRNHGFGTIKLDSQYGNLWQGIIKQSMNDPLFIKPPCPCEFDFFIYDCNFFWNEDNGFCIGDDDINKQYPHRNEYEAMCAVPQGAPPLPQGLYLGCLRPSQFTSTDCPQGNLCYPPIADANLVYHLGVSCGCYLPIPFDTPWSFFLREQQCVCDHGRFAPQYEANGVQCPRITSPPP